MVASFPGRRRNSLATSVSSNPIVYCIELLQSCPFYFNSDRSIVLVLAFWATSFV